MKLSLMPNVMRCFALVTWTICQANGKNVRIARAELDTFTNVGGCNETNAVCLDKTCTDCQCIAEQTFVQTRGKYGKCIPNQLLVYATSYEASFLVRNNLKKVCPYPKEVQAGGKTFVLARTSCKTGIGDSDYRWLWTTNGQLLSWETMECVTDNYNSRSGIHFLIMDKCDRNNQQQLWECVGEKKYDILQSMSGRYMNFGEYHIYMTSRNTSSDMTKWTRFNNTEKDVCSQAVGCNTFADGSSIVILNKTKCAEQSECLGQKEINLSKIGCMLSPNEAQYLHNDTWKSLQLKNSSFLISLSEGKVFLTWNLKRTPKSWGGLIVKVPFKCEEGADTKTSETDHCVVIKYAGSFTGFYDDDEIDEKDTDNGDDDDDDDDDDNDNGGDGVDDGDTKNNKDKTNKDNDQDSESEDKDNTQTIIIIVCVLVVLFIAGVIAFVIYRHRNRFVRSRKTSTEKREKQLPSKAEYAASMNPLYPSNNNQAAQRECELYESTPDHVYQYVDADHKNAGAPPRDFTYDYAFHDGPSNNSQRSNVENNTREKGTSGDNECDERHKEDREGEAKDTTPKPLPHKYHVLEEP